MSAENYLRFRHYEKLMKESRKSINKQKPPSCAKCEYYQPYFKYRKCLHTRCPYGFDADIFRKNPLNKDMIPNRRW